MLVTALDTGGSAYDRPCHRSATMPTRTGSRAAESALFDLGQIQPARARVQIHWCASPSMMVISAPTRLTSQEGGPMKPKARPWQRPDRTGVGAVVPSPMTESVRSIRLHPFMSICPVPRLAWACSQGQALIAVPCQRTGRPDPTMQAPARGPQKRSFTRLETTCSLKGARARSDCTSMRSDTGDAPRVCPSHQYSARARKRSASSEEPRFPDCPAGCPLASSGSLRAGAPWQNWCPTLHQTRSASYGLVSLVYPNTFNAITKTIPPHLISHLLELRSSMGASTLYSDGYIAIQGSGQRDAHGCFCSFPAGGRPRLCVSRCVPP